MTKQITRQQLSAALVERHGQERQKHLYTASVGIAGLGGLGRVLEQGAAASSPLTGFLEDR